MNVPSPNSLPSYASLGRQGSRAHWIPQRCATSASATFPLSLTACRFSWRPCVCRYYHCRLYMYVCCTALPRTLCLNSRLFNGTSGSHQPIYRNSVEVGGNNSTEFLVSTTGFSPRNFVPKERREFIQSAKNWVGRRLFFTMAFCGCKFSRFCMCCATWAEEGKSFPD